jgi:hypothetical protein
MIFELSLRLMEQNDRFIDRFANVPAVLSKFIYEKVTRIFFRWGERRR